MDADWYVDPLGRFEGRYFDGENWTDQVSDRGVLAVDPDWGRDLSAAGVEVSGASSEPKTPSSRSAFSDATGAVEDPAVISLRPDSSAAAGLDVPTGIGADLETDIEINEVAAVHPDPPASDAETRRDYSVESPTRTVAVLGDEDDTVVSSAAPVVVTEADTERRSGRGWLWALVGLALLAALALIALPRLFGSDGEVADPAEQEPAAAETEGDVDTTQAGSAGDGDAGNQTGTEGDPDTGDQDVFADPDAPLSSEDSVRVGSYDFVNAKQVLDDLVIWHRRHAEDRGVAIPADSDCWFGVMGSAVVQNAQCGPVRATPGAEPRFDLVPLKFEDVDAGVIRVRPLTDAVVTDEVLPNEIELIGRDGTAIDRYELAERFDPPARGERNTSGG